MVCVDQSAALSPAVGEPSPLMVPVATLLDLPFVLRPSPSSDGQGGAADTGSFQYGIRLQPEDSPSPWPDILELWGIRDSSV